MDISFETENNLKFLKCFFLTYPTDLDINFLILTSGNLKSLRVRCIVMFLVRWENLTAISFLGFSDRCQYLTWEKKEVVESPWRKYTSVQIVHVPHICKTFLHSHKFEEDLPISIYMYLRYFPAICHELKYSHPHSTHLNPPTASEPRPDSYLQQATSLGRIPSPPP